MLVIVDRLMIIVYYELVKITIDAPSLVQIIIDLVVYYHGLSNSIVTDCSSVFISKFLFLLCYFLEIK